MLWSCFLFLLFYKVRKCKSDEEQSVDNIPFIRAVKKVSVSPSWCCCCVQVGSHLVDFELISREIWRVIQSFSKFKKCFYLILTAIFSYFREHLVHNFTRIDLKTHQYGTSEGSNFILPHEMNTCISPSLHLTVVDWVWDALLCFEISECLSYTTQKVWCVCS